MPLLFAFADSHVTVFVPSETWMAGLERPLTLANGLVRPGLDHPPPGLGDGLRDSVIGIFGVPGIVGRMCSREGEASVSFEAPWSCKLGGAFEDDTEDFRRR